MNEEVQKVEQEAAAGLKAAEPAVQTGFHKIVDWSSAHPQFMIGVAFGFLLGAVLGYLFA